MVARIGRSTSKVGTILVGIETLSRLSIFRSMFVTVDKHENIFIACMLKMSRSLCHFQKKSVAKQT